MIKSAMYPSMEGYNTLKKDVLKVDFEGHNTYGSSAEIIESTILEERFHESF